MTTLQDSMSASALERAERYKPNVREKFFPLTMLETLTWLGSFSWANPALKMRFIQQDIVINLFGVPQTPPELARDYLKAKYIEPRRHTVGQFNAINVHRAAPLFCKIGQYDEMVYVDLSSAYWTILKIVGWDVDYNPSRWLGKKSEMDDFPLADNKLARNCLITAGLITKRHIWTGSQLRLFGGRNALVNYDIWALAQDILHSLAHIAKLAGAVYIHTDGYIVPRSLSDPLRSEIHNWGFSTKVKAEGDCDVYGIGAYRVGDQMTKHRAGFVGTNIDTTYEPDVAWLRPRIAKLARTTIHW